MSVISAWILDIPVARDYSITEQLENEFVQADFPNQ